MPESEAWNVGRVSNFFFFLRPVSEDGYNSASVCDKSSPDKTFINHKSEEAEERALTRRRVLSNTF